MQTSTKHAPTKAIVEALLENKGSEASFPIVMASAAGWYVGQVYVDNDFQFLGPYDRLTEYMSEDDAIKWWDMGWKDDYALESKLGV